MSIKKYNDTFWDFVGADTKEYTHTFHVYPAMMIPQVAREIINRYKNDDMKVLFDPYCGTGTSLVEGSLANLKIQFLYIDDSLYCPVRRVKEFVT